MCTAEGRFRRIHDGVPHCAIVEVTVTLTEDESTVVTNCQGKGWECQGSLEDAPPTDYDDWKSGAVCGALFALLIAQRTANVTVNRITGMVTVQILQRCVVRLLMRCGMLCHTHRRASSEEDG